MVHVLCKKSASPSASIIAQGLVKVACTAQHSTNLKVNNARHKLVPPTYVYAVRVWILRDQPSIFSHAIEHAFLAVQQIFRRVKFLDFSIWEHQDPAKGNGNRRFLKLPQICIKIQNTSIFIPLAQRITQMHIDSYIKNVLLMLLNLLL